MSAIDAYLPNAAAREADISRPVSGRRSRNLTITLLADYGIRHQVSWPSAGIVALLGEFGVTGTAARAALSRLARRGVLQVSRTGRHTAYRLTGEVATALTIGGQRIARFAHDSESWDGEWTLVAFSGAGDGSAPRRLRNRLRWLGYAPLYDGLWVSARADPELTVDSLGELKPAALTVLRGREAGLPGADRSPLDAWDLALVADGYHEFLRAWGWLLESPGATADGRAALVARTRLMDDYRSFPALDPQLPAQLMPGRWPRQAAWRLFERSYDALGQRAEARVREVLTENGVPIPCGLGHHTVADLSAAMAG